MREGTGLIIYVHHCIGEVRSGVKPMSREGVISRKRGLCRSVLTTLILIAFASTACVPGPMLESAPCDALPAFAPKDLAFDHSGSLWLAEVVTKPPKAVVRLDPANGPQRAIR